MAQSDVFFGHSHQTHDENFQNSHVTNYSGSLPAWNIKCLLFFFIKKDSIIHGCIRVCISSAKCFCQNSCLWTYKMLDYLLYVCSLESIESDHGAQVKAQRSEAVAHVHRWQNDHLKIQLQGSVRGQ